MRLVFVTLRKMGREEIAEACLWQARWCATLASPLYEGLLIRIADDVRAGGPCWTALEPHTAEPPRPLTLRFLAVVHRMVLEGRLPEAAPYYPSVGGKADIEALWPIFREAAPRAPIPSGVQTNEVGRCCALLPGFLALARDTGLPLRLLEIGSSAGLNLRWDCYRYQSSGGAWGPPDSPVVFPDAFTGAVPIGTPARVVERRGCDLNPIDPTLDDSRITLLSFVWADQVARFGQLTSALEVARRVPAEVDRSDAIPWLDAQVAEPRIGVATVVYHSIVLPYLSEEGRDTIARILRNAGARATVNAPLAWLSMEAGRVQAEVHLTVWPGGERRLIAETGFHGRDVKVL
jgi:hypothetical protein